MFRQEPEYPFRESSEMKRYAIVTALAACLLALAGCSSGGNSTDGGTVPQAPAPQAPASTPSTISVWNSDNCLSDLAVDGNNALVVRASNLCRYADTSANPGFWYLAGRQANGQLGDWIGEVGVENDGYRYWTYNTSNGQTPWFRAPTAGGTIEIKTTSGYTSWPEWSAAYPVEAATYQGYEQIAQLSVHLYQSSTQGYTPVSTNQQAVSAGQDILKAQNQQQSQQTQQLQDAQSGTITITQAQLDAMFAEENAKLASIIVQPECNFSYNGCW